MERALEIALLEELQGLKDNRKFFLEDAVQNSPVARYHVAGSPARKTGSPWSGSGCLRIETRTVTGRPAMAAMAVLEGSSATHR